MNKIAVVIPYYNASKHIINVINKIPLYIDAIIIVNDKSPDSLPVNMLKTTANFEKVIILENEINLGVGGATKKGFKHAINNDFDIVVKLDADDQMDTSYLPQLLKPIINKKAHVTKGNRFKDIKALRKMPFVRRFGNLGLSFLTKVATGYWSNFDPTNGFIAAKTSTLKQIDFEKLSNRYFFETSLMAELYFCKAYIKDVAMPAIYADEKSSMKVWKMPFVFASKLGVLFCKRILKTYFLYDFNIASIYLFFGIPLFLFGIVFGIYKWIYYFALNQLAPTGTIMIIVLAIILGFQLLLQAIQYDIINTPNKK